MPETGFNTSDNGCALAQSSDDLTKRLLRIARWCGVGAMLVGISGLLGWIFGLPVLNSIIPGLKPIAISAAIAFIVLGGVQVLIARPSLPRALNTLLLGITLLMTVFGLLEIVYLLTGLHVSFEDVILRQFPSITDKNVEISPVAGILVFLIALAQSCFLYQRVSGKSSRVMANLIGLLGSLTFFISAVFFLSYLYGTPLLYRTVILPIAWLATIAGLLLGIGLVMSAGRDALPLCVFTGSSTRARLLRAFLPLAALQLLLLSIVQYFLLRVTSINPAILTPIIVVVFEILVVVVIQQVSRVLGNLIDRTERERQRVAEELREREQDLNRAQAVAHIGSWRLDVQHNALRWSDEAYRMFGIPRGTPMTYEAFLATVHPEDLEYVDENWTAALHGAPYDIEHRIVVDGAVKWVHERAELEVDPHGTLLGGFGTVQDITEQKQSEEALRTSEETFRTIFNSVYDAIFLHDVAGHILEVNDSMLEMYGVTREETHGTDILLYSSESNPLDSLPGIWQRVLTGETQYFPWRARRPRTGEEFDVEVYLRKLQLYGREMIMANVRDVTARKQAEEALRALTETLEQRVYDRTAALEVSNKELEAFSYSVSHDLRAPLRSIDGFSKILLEQYLAQLDAQGQDYLTRVRNAAQRMGRFIDDMLNLSRIGRVQMRCETVNLSALAASVIDDLRQRDPDRQVTVEIMPDLLVTGDAALLRIVLDNLLGNAWKFTRKREDARITMGVTKKDGERVYYVRDNGAGFDMSYADKLFTPFQRLHTEEEFPGTGIGLAIVQRIIARHGGRVWAEGKEGEGATIFFTIGEA